MCSVLLVLAALAPTAPVRSAEPTATTRMIQATFKLVNPSSTATCLLLSRPHPGEDKKSETILVTAAHVLQQMTGEQATLVLRKASKDGTYARHELNLKVRVKDRPLWTKHATTDVAVLPIQLPEGVAAVPLPLSALARETDIKTGRFGPGDDVRVACYPVRFEIGAAAFPIIRRGAIAGYPLTPTKAHNTFLVDYNNFVGDSGGPVFVLEKNQEGETMPLVAGVVLGQHLYDERTKLAFEERVLHHRLGLAIVVHADFVRETVALLPKVNNIP
jgi:hypothetical protein